MNTEKDDIADIDEIELDLLEHEHYEVNNLMNMKILFVGQGYKVK